MELTETEWRVMNVVWEHHPVRVREVLERLEDETGWAYSTVKTILTRLADKGALTVRAEGNARLYAPALSRDDARGSAVRSLLDRAFGGTVGALVHHVLDARDISKKDRAAIRALIDEEFAPKKRKK